jgi:hypothetical protein
MNHLLLSKTHAWVKHGSPSHGKHDIKFAIQTFIYLELSKKLKDDI